MTRLRVASIALALFLQLGTGEVAKAETITLDQALTRAANHADLQIEGAKVDAAIGRETQVGTIGYNPELSGGFGPRFGGGETVLDFELGLSQTIELGDKRGRRRAVSHAMVQAAKARQSWTNQLVTLRVRRSFAMASAAKQVLQTTREAEDVAAELKATSDERLALGAGNMLEVNLAAAGLGRARRRRSEAQRALIATEYELAAAVGSDAKVRLSPAGDLGPLPTIAVDVEALVARALHSRHDQAALVREQAAAKASVRLADSVSTPNLNLGANYAHEEGSDQILATLSIELPFWNRNRGGLVEARANHRLAKVAVEYGDRELRRQVRAAVARYQAARKTVEAFDKDAVGKLADTLDLTREAFERGKISMLEFNLLRTEFVDVRLAYLEAKIEELGARFELELAVGKRL